jgi:predicted MFS family arabinose efflux permease
MNTPGYVMSCRTNKKASLEMPSWIPGCIPMNEGKYGFVTSIYSIGGLFGSLYAPRLADGQGRRGAALINCSGFVLGPIVMALSPNVWILALGRVVSGLSAGVVCAITG